MDYRTVADVISMPIFFYSVSGLALAELRTWKISVIVIDGMVNEDNGLANKRRISGCPDMAFSNNVINLL